MASGAQQAHEGIAEDGVAQMADVRGLVGIDAGVLDQNFAADVGCAFAGMVGDRDALAAGQRPGRDSALQTSIDVSGAGDLQLLEAVRQRQFGDNLFGDFARGFAQALGQFERSGSANSPISTLGG